MSSEPSIAVWVLLTAAGLAVVWLTVACRVIAAHYHHLRSRHDLVVDATQMRLDYYQLLDGRREVIEEDAYDVDVEGEGTASGGTARATDGVAGTVGPAPSGATGEAARAA